MSCWRSCKRTQPTRWIACAISPEVSILRCSPIKGCRRPSRRKLEGSRPTVLEADRVGRYGQDVETAVYFCTLEALNNVAKYARAATTTITLSQEDGYLTFTVHDDGKEFDPARTALGTGLRA